MKQLTGLDATFLHMETASQFGHVAGLSIFTRPDRPGYEPYAAWRAQLEQRLHLLEPLRRRLAEVPLGLDHPYWIADPDFDLDFHVRHTAVPPPGSDDQLERLVGRIVARPLDRRRPLWLSYVIEGLADERFAVLTVFHHATVDGASGVELLTLMLDEDPTCPDVEPPTKPWRPESEPSSVELLARGWLGLARKPARAALLGAQLTLELGRASRNPVLIAASEQARHSLRGPFGAMLNFGRDRGEDRDAPPVIAADRAGAAHAVQPADHPASQARDRLRVAGHGPRDQVHVQVTVNDVVMAVCAAGLRTWLERHEALPDDPLSPSCRSPCARRGTRPLDEPGVDAHDGPSHGRARSRRPPAPRPRRHDQQQGHLPGAARGPAHGFRRVPPARRLRPRGAPQRAAASRLADCPPATS
jgi:WS/DGAT/MGAT family acyltransferase